MSKPLTIKQLLKQCQEEIRKGHGDYSIMLSDDDEGNGYHYCWYTFTEIDEYTEDFVDTSIAPKENTIILG